MSPYDDDMSIRAPSPGSQDAFEIIDYFSHGRNVGAEDAANELEESLLGSRGKGKAVRKRRAGDESSDESSEADIPIAARHGPQTKKRRIAKGPAPNPLEGHTHTLYPESMSAMTGTLSLPGKSQISGRGRGKGKQREDSVDSASVTTPRGRKKPGPKKRTDHLPPHTIEALGLGASASASVSRDITPAGSRAPSPTLTNVSATVYELDDAIPQLRRARRIDDAGMWKRVKTLEEAQRKVWTNIARRDVVKVCIYLWRSQFSTEFFARCIATILLDTRRVRRSSRGSPHNVPCRRVSHTCAQRRAARTSRLKASVSCARCWFSGRKTKKKSAT